MGFAIMSTKSMSIKEDFITAMFIVNFQIFQLTMLFITMFIMFINFNLIRLMG